MGLLKIKNGLKWAEQHNKPYFSPQRTQNQDINWIYGITAYVHSNIFTPVLQNFTCAVLALPATFRKSGHNHCIGVVGP